jgi:hypothetical protein
MLPHCDTLRRTGFAVCSVPLATSAATIEEDTAKEFVKGATETFVAFRKDAVGKTGASEIPKKFWAASIRDLKPVKVYIHINNVVVVQKVADGKEEGLYIYEPYSSQMPMDGLHGFALTPKPNTAGSYTLGTGVFSYHRLTRLILCRTSSHCALLTVRSATGASRR